MGYSIGWDSTWNRDIGYGVPAVCDHPECDKEIHRGLAYVCGEEAYGGDNGCGLFFCDEHRDYSEELECSVCEQCQKSLDPFTPKPDVPEWINWKMTDPSWAEWRKTQ